MNKPKITFGKIQLNVKKPEEIPSNKQEEEARNNSNDESVSGRSL